MVDDKIPPHNSDSRPCIVQHAAADGYSFAARVWRVTNPVGQAVLLHGIISHSGWYGPTCAALAQAGWEVHFLDRRGSGLNSRARGDVDNYYTWISDVVQYMDSMTPVRPRLLIGISWGGKLATALARRHAHLLDGLGLISPGLFALRGVNRWQRLALRLASRTPLRAVRVTIPLEEPALFTASSQWQQFIRTDPLVLRRVTVRFAWADQMLTRDAIGSSLKLRCPTLLALAGQDRIIDTDRVRAFTQSAAQAGLTRLEYKQATHTFEFDPVQFAYTRDLLQWARGVHTARPIG